METYGLEKEKKKKHETNKQGHLGKQQQGEEMSAKGGEQGRKERGRGKKHTSELLLAQDQVLVEMSLCGDVAAAGDGAEVADVVQDRLVYKPVLRLWTRRERRGKLAAMGVDCSWRRVRTL